MYTLHRRGLKIIRAIKRKLYIFKNFTGKIHLKNDNFTKTYEIRSVYAKLTKLFNNPLIQMSRSYIVESMLFT